MTNTTIAILIIDSTNGIDKQDKKIIEILVQKITYLFIIFNKFDLIKDKNKTKQELKDFLYNNIYQVKNYNCFWCSFGFNKKFSSKLLFMMMSSIQRKKVNILEEKFETSFFYIKDFLDLGTWKDLKHKKIFFNEH